MAKKRNMPPPLEESASWARRERKKTVKVLMQVEDLADELGMTPVEVCQKAIIRGENAWDLLETFRALEELELERAIERA